jgi:RNA polymerase sigma factor (TIGR02999 family)
MDRQVRCLGPLDRDDPSVLDLLPKVYDELRKIAARQLSGRLAGSTLQPTALVHEAWLRLEGEQQHSFENRAHFLSAAAETMRNLLIDRARARQTLKRGGGHSHVPFEQVEIADETALEDEKLLALSAAIDRLALEHPQMAEFVKLRYFTGLHINEAAMALGISRATANRWWLFARTWLYQEMGEEGRP